MLVHRFSLGDRSLAVSTRRGARLEVPWTELAVILRAARRYRTDVEHTEVVPTWSVADDTPNFVTRTERSSAEDTEQLVILYLRDGRSALFSTNELAFECLGEAKQPTVAGNIAALAASLRHRARGAFYDDSLVRLGCRTAPLVAEHEARTRLADGVRTRSSTSRSLDVLAEVIRKAASIGLLP